MQGQSVSECLSSDPVRQTGRCRSPWSTVTSSAALIAPSLHGSRADGGVRLRRQRWMPDAAPERRPASARVAHPGADL